MDEISDLDLVVVCRDEHQPELLRDTPAFAARLGPLLACFTGEHVGEPRLPRSDCISWSILGAWRVMTRDA